MCIHVLDRTHAQPNRPSLIAGSGTKKETVAVEKLASVSECSFQKLNNVHNNHQFVAGCVWHDPLHNYIKTCGTK